MKNDFYIQRVLDSVKEDGTIKVGDLLGASFEFLLICFITGTILGILVYFIKLRRKK